MKREEREQLLKDTLLYFAPKDRYVTDEEGNVYYREDVTLKSMELSEPPLPPAEGAEQAEIIIDDWFHEYCEGRCEKSEMIAKLTEFAAQQQPTAEGAVRHLTDDEIEKHGMEGGLRDGELQMYWEGATWYRSYAQKIADKMVSERLREELIAYDKAEWLKTFGKEFGGQSLEATIESIDEYLNSRER